jgi:surface protein
MNSFDTSYLNNIKSKYILKTILGNIKENLWLKIIKYNKEIQNKLNINKNDYKAYSDIEVEIIPINKEYQNTFIKIENKDNIPFYHFYFNDKLNEIKRTYFTKGDKVDKIKIIIDYKIKSLSGLFEDCKCIRKISFAKFNRKNINGMSHLFSGCSSLEEINFFKFNTENINIMRNMFYGCSSLKELNLSNFNTNNVTNMYCMFYGCNSLEKLDISSFNTDNVTDMYCMFWMLKIKKIKFFKFYQ